MSIQQLLSPLYLHQYLIELKSTAKFSLPRYYIPLLRDSLKHQVFEQYAYISKPRHKTLFSLFRQPELLLTKYTSHLALPTTHPIFSTVKNKVTPGWWFTYAHNANKTYLSNGDSFYVILTMCGHNNAIWEEPAFLTTLQQWAKNGLDIPSASFELQQILEIKQHQALQRISDGSRILALPAYPITMADCSIPAPSKHIQLHLQSPTLIDKYHQSYSITTVAEKIMARALRLQLLYCKSDTLWHENPSSKYNKLFSADEQTYLLPLLDGIRLHSLQLQYADYIHQSPNLKSKNKLPIPIEGYLGNIDYTIANEQQANAVLPLLALAETLNIGEHISYGNGKVKYHVF